MTMLESDLAHMELGLHALSMVGKRARDAEGSGPTWSTTVDMLVAAMIRASRDGCENEVSDLAWSLVQKAHRTPGNADCPASVAAARAVVCEFIDGWPEWLAPHRRM